MKSIEELFSVAKDINPDEMVSLNNGREGAYNKRVSEKALRDLATTMYEAEPIQYKRFLKEGKDPVTEIMNGLIALIDDEKLTVHDLIKIIPGPDFSTSGVIIGTAGIQQAYHTGKGVIQIRAKADIEVKKNDREQIVITELPYQVNKAKLIEKIAELVTEKAIEGISDIRDESSREGIRVVIDVKRGEQASVILNRLYKQIS